MGLPFCFRHVNYSHFGYKNIEILLFMTTFIQTLRRRPSTRGHQSFTLNPKFFCKRISNAFKPISVRPEDPVQNNDLKKVAVNVQVERQEVNICITKSTESSWMEAMAVLGLTQFHQRKMRLINSKCMLLVLVQLINLTFRR